MLYLLSQLLSETARHFPDKDAVVCQGETISYAALDDLSNRLAHTLKAHGVRRGDRVGIYVDKSIAAILCIFGVLKADAVYVPLDPLAPTARLRYIMQDCGIACLLSAANKLDAIAQMLGSGNPLQCVVLTGSTPAPVALSGVETVTWDAVLEACRTAPALHNVATDLAYILYTSGSTGAPKGVMISHLNALTFINWAAETIGVCSTDRVANHAPLHFDLSIFDIFATIKAGGTLYVVPAEMARFPLTLTEFIAHQGITVWYSVPSAWVLMLTRGKMERFNFSAVRVIIFAGEVFPVKHLRSLMEQIPHAAYFNWYGPTETNVITSYRLAGLPDEQQAIPIGKACANMEVFALDSAGGLVTATGVVGELYARGSCVAQGYWSDAAKTAQLFVRNPLQAHFDERVYRTGDLVKLDAQGQYIYLGRRDHQVKIQGYRVELGEVEAALLSHPAVEEAAVVVRRNQQQVSYLTAYIVPHQPCRLQAVELKRHCAQRLPKYMIPEVIAMRDSLPKTSTGKIDKQALVAEE